MISDTVIIRTLGLEDYLTTWLKMQQFTQHRDSDTPDEIWLVEHPAVFTQGQNGKAEHILSSNHIPVIQSDRGGQVTYHGPGQLIAYTLIDLKRKKLNTREIITILEQSVIELLESHSIQAYAKCEAPGVYVENNKICSIGLRIRRGCAFHGLALNVAMNLDPFLLINPCGFPNLKMTQIKDFVKTVTITSTGTKLVKHLIANLGYTNQLIS